MVTGATGFIGNKLCAVLASHGHQVVAMQRGNCHSPNVNESHKVDFSDNATQLPDLDDVDVVFHLAGIAHQSAASEEYYQVNCVGALMLARHAAQQGVKHFIFLSSTKAMGSNVASEVRSESDLGSTKNDVYGDSKRRAEKALELLANKTSMAITTIRPPLVYGKGVKGNMQTLVKAGMRGMPRPALAGGLSMVSLPDLVDGLLVLGSQRAVGYRCFILCDNEHYTTQRILDAVVVGKAGVPAPWSVPLPLCRIACWLRDLVFGNIGANKTEGTYEKLFGQSLFSNAAIQQQTSWRPRQTLELMMPAIIETLSHDAYVENKRDSKP